MLRAESHEDMLDWINALRLAMPKAHVIKEGMLRKRGEVNKAFQDRFFELSATHIVYFDDAVWATLPLRPTNASPLQHPRFSFAAPVPLLFVLQDTRKFKGSIALGRVQTVSEAQEHNCFNIFAFSRTFELAARSNEEYVGAARRTAA